MLRILMKGEDQNFAIKTKEVQISDSLIKERLQRIVEELKNKLNKPEITYTEVGNYIYEECEIKIDPEIGSKIMEICHNKIRNRDYLVHI